jgi:outer membrane protein OmpA-like peptidoglycan-associated protein
MVSTCLGAPSENRILADKYGKNAGDTGRARKRTGLRCERVPGDSPSSAPLARSIAGQGFQIRPYAPVRSSHGAAQPVPLLSRPVGNHSDGPASMFMTRKPFIVVALLLAFVALAPQGFAQQGDRVLIFFDDFSANLTQKSRAVIADAAKDARESKARAIRIEARASATGSVQANIYLALTRGQVVADQLAKDGVDPAMIRQVPIGQTGSEDPSVAERRVDIVIER